MSIGSEWNKWDLHIHTPLSIVQHYGNDTEEVWEKYIKDIENLPPEFKVLGINDYLFLDGYERLKKEKEQNGRLRNINLMLPVIEFRIEKFAGVEFSGLKRINLHVIFSDKLNIETIKSQFLNTLEQSYSIESNSEKWHRAITKDSLRDLGQKIIDSAPEEQKQKYQSPLIEGFNNLNIKEDDIFKTLDKDCFVGKYLIAIGKTEWDELKWSESSIATKKDIINKSDIIFTSSKSIEAFNKAKSKLKECGVKDLLLDCSDAHYFSNSREKDRIGKCYTWIKADTTFEGLKQVIYEPTRIYIGENKPQAAIYKIEEIKLNFDDNIKWGEDNFCFANFKEAIKFSPYLNCIIGGRGSGKSTLLNLIAEKIGKGNKDIFRQLSEKDIALKVDIIPNSIQNIEYLAQNEIEEFATNSKKFTQAIFERLNKKSDDRLKSIQEQVSLKLDKFDRQISRLIARYEIAKNLNEKNIELQNANRLLKTFTDKQFNKNYAMINVLLAEKNTRVKWKSNYQEYISNLLSMINEIESKFLDKDESSDTWTHDNTYKKSCELLRDELKSVLNKYQNISFDKDEKRLCEIEQNIGELKSSIDTYLNSMGYTLENLSDLKKAISNISNIENEIKSFNDRMESIEQEIREFSISDIDDDVNDFKNNIDAEISNINDYFADIANSNPQNVKNIQVCYSLEDNIIDNVIDEFASILNLKISATSKDYLRQVGYNSVLNAENTQNFIEHIPYRNSQAYNILIDIFSLDLNFEIYKLLIKKHLRDINQYKILKVLYDNKKLERSSFGQRCTAVIVMLLSLGNNPIIIDEPETHLDSLLIANYLVELIKQQKNGRQIIFATHNANFVLNADAELIVKLENIDGFSTSTSFTIEDLSHREDLLKLEGGKEAFKKREQKYDI